MVRVGHPGALPPQLAAAMHPREVEERLGAPAPQGVHEIERRERTWMISRSIVVAARRGRARRNARGERCASRQLSWVGTRCSLWRG